MTWLIGLVGLTVALVLWYLWLNRDVASEIRTENAGGQAGTVLVVYHPGREGSFRNHVIAGFAD